MQRLPAIGESLRKSTPMGETMNTKEKTCLTRWIELHRCCAVCHWPESDWRRALHVHHIAGGAARSKGHKTWNYLRLCERCHGIVHSGAIIGNFPDITKKTILQAKFESDPSHYSPRLIAELKGWKSLPYKRTAIPQYFIQERARNLWTTRVP